MSKKQDSGAHSLKLQSWVTSGVSTLVIYFGARCTFDVKLQTTPHSMFCFTSQSCPDSESPAEETKPGDVLQELIKCAPATDQHSVHGTRLERLQNDPPPLPHLWKCVFCRGHSTNHSTFWTCYCWVTILGNTDTIVVLPTEPTGISGKLA